MDDRLISLNVALKELENLNITSFYELNEHSKEVYTEVKAMFKILPTVDAIPVIRCKDCLHNRACEIQYHAQAGDLFFCGAAERKDGEYYDTV